jgi:hypothetical protein
MEVYMLYTFAVVLFALWFLAYMTAFTLGGLIHILLLGAIISIMIRFLSGKKMADG